MNFNYLQVECYKLAISFEEIQEEIVQIKPDLNVTINQYLETEVSLDKILDLKQISVEIKPTQKATLLFTKDVQLVKLYIDAEISKSEIFKDNNNTIIYMWFNKVTGEVYIGSAWYGNKRLSSYYWSSVLNSTPPKKSRIYNSLLKYGHSNFSLAILEICDLNGPIDKRFYLETFYITWGINVYGNKVLNVLIEGGSSLAYIHTPESKLKMSELKIA